MFLRNLVDGVMKFFKGGRLQKSLGNPGLQQLLKNTFKTYLILLKLLFFTLFLFEKKNNYLNKNYIFNFSFKQTAILSKKSFRYLGKN